MKRKTLTLALAAAAFAATTYSTQAAAGDPILHHIPHRTTVAMPIGLRVIR